MEGLLHLNPLLCCEPLAEHDGELCPGSSPFAWRHLPLPADLAQYQEQQLGGGVIVGKVTAAAPPLRRSGRSPMLAMTALRSASCSASATGM